MTEIRSVDEEVIFNVHKTHAGKASFQGNICSQGQLEMTILMIHHKKIWPKTRSQIEGQDNVVYFYSSLRDPRCLINPIFLKIVSFRLSLSYFCMKYFIFPIF